MWLCALDLDILRSVVARFFQGLTLGVFDKYTYDRKVKRLGDKFKGGLIEKIKSAID